MHAFLYLAFLGIRPAFAQQKVSCMLARLFKPVEWIKLLMSGPLSAFELLLGCNFLGSSFGRGHGAQPSHLLGCPLVP